MVLAKFVQPLVHSVPYTGCCIEFLFASSYHDSHSYQQTTDGESSVLASLPKEETD